MRERKAKIIYFENELEDEFSTAKITPRLIDDRYNYQGGVLRKIGRIIIYHIIAKPIAFIFLKTKFQHKIINKEVLKQAKRTGFFLYGNHTNPIADALIPTMIGHPKGVYVIVHANNVSMPVLGKLTPCLGAIPLPDDKVALKNFNKMVEDAISGGKCITIYPEAHIWPYYTKIRNYKDSSFKYPVKYGVPVFAFTNTYQKKRFGKSPRIVTYLDGPFYPDENLTLREQRRKLHAVTIKAMRERSKNSNVEIIKYVKKED